MYPLSHGYPANPDAVSAFERCGVSVLCLTEAAEFFFVTADGGGNGVQRDTEVGGGESGVCASLPWARCSSMILRRSGLW